MLLSCTVDCVGVYHGSTILTMFLTKYQDVDGRGYNQAAGHYPQETYFFASWYGSKYPTPANRCCQNV